VRVYAGAGFTVQTVLMDNEFEKVWDHMPEANMNTPAAAEHIGEIECKIRVMKEQARGIHCTLPYKAFPQLMLIHLFYFIVMWLNNFQVVSGISAAWSPREIILHHQLNYTHHCRAPFGAYCEMLEDNVPTNDMSTQGILAICLGPTGNFQGTYNFLSLVSGLLIKCRCFGELPAPDAVIFRDLALAKKLASQRISSSPTVIVSLLIGLIKLSKNLIPRR
jgi:hypothetical protein